MDISSHASDSVKCNGNALKHIGWDRYCLLFLGLGQPSFIELPTADNGWTLKSNEMSGEGGIGIPQGDNVRIPSLYKDLRRPLKRQRFSRLPFQPLKHLSFLALTARYFSAGKGAFRDLELSVVSMGILRIKSGCSEKFGGSSRFLVFLVRTIGASETDLRKPKFQIVCLFFSAFNASLRST